MNFWKYAKEYNELTAKENALYEQAKAASNPTEAAMYNLRAYEMAQKKRELTIRFRGE